MVVSLTRADADEMNGCVLPTIWVPAITCIPGYVRSGSFVHAIIKDWYSEHVDGLAECTRDT